MSDIKPILKWAGGKRQLLKYIVPLLPDSFDNYYEPFIGGGALLFKLQPTNAHINDLNKELINLYLTIKNDIYKLIDELDMFDNTAECFYRVRKWDRDSTFYNNLSSVTKAARLLYLNKTCYNGLYRVNKSGYFNTPYGYYKSITIDKNILFNIHKYFNDANIVMTSKDYKSVLKNIPSNSFVYLDPPYDPISKTSSFTNYTQYEFDKEQQIELKHVCDELTDKNVKFILSNSKTDFISELYFNYNIKIVNANRNINSYNYRHKVEELIIRNYI